jgi:hypothetical protein
VPRGLSAAVHALQRSRRVLPNDRGRAVFVRAAVQAAQACSSMQIPGLFGHARDGRCFPAAGARGVLTEDRTARK